MFLPCYCDALFPQVGIATVKLFARLGLPLEYPFEQTCCGQPAFNAGHWMEAKTLAERFSTIFDSYRWVVVPSGSCGAMVTASYATIGASAMAVELGSRVFDLARFLVEIVGVTDVGATFNAKVTYHDGCHGRREFASTDAAVRLLGSVRGLEYVELPHIEECCGFGGLFSIKYPALSGSMGEAKVDSIRQTAASVVTSGDSSCLMHIEGVLRKCDAHSPLKFVHLAEILASGS